MLRFFSFVVTVLACAFTQGCASHYNWVPNEATNVVYSNDNRSEGALKTPYGTSLYLDRDGDMYPPASVKLAGNLFTTSGLTTATLYEYFKQPSARGEWSVLMSELGLPAGAVGDDLWKRSQQELAARAARTIVEGSGRGDRPIVFLVHGFNNDFGDAVDWYALAEKDIARRVHARRGVAPFFVRVHWDGLEQPLPVSIWTRAQWNGPLTGLALRSVLGGMDGKLRNEAQIAMLSHSTGALVVVNAVGDGSAALECDGEFKEHCQAVQRQETIPKLVANIRLGMLIPAASLTTFDAYRKSKNLPQAIILGLNRQDFPTNKVLGCIWLGATCLNTKPERTCEKLKAVFKDKITTDVATLEFSNSATHENQTWLFWETHKVEHQMMRERWDAFIERVLFPSAGLGPDAAVQCDQQKSAVQAAKET